MCKPQGRCGKDHFAAESGGRYRTVAREKGMYHRCGPAGEHDDGGVRGGNGKSSPGCHARECAAGNHAGQTPGAEASHVAGQVDVLPASLDLAATEVIMNTTPGREFLFREIIRGLEKKYDHILIDCPPSLGIITQNALMASDFVIIPTDGNYFAMKGIEKIHYIIGLLRRKLGAEVRILGYFMTKYNAGRKLDVDIRESLIETLGESVFETTIRNNVALGEAQYNARSIFDYAPSSNGARDYRSLTEEFLKRIRKMNK